MCSTVQAPQTVLNDVINLLSIKNSRNILIAVNHTINLYILVSRLVDNHIIFPYCIFTVCSKADSFGEVCTYSRKHLKIFKFTINFIYDLYSIFFIIFRDIIPDIFQILCNNRINPIVAKDLKNIRDYIAEDNEEYAAKTIKEIYGKFENLQMFPEMGSDLSKRVSFRTDYKYAIWEDYVIIYKVRKEDVEIYRVINRYQDITRIFD